MLHFAKIDCIKNTTKITNLFFGERNPASDGVSVPFLDIKLDFLAIAPAPERNFFRGPGMHCPSKYTKVSNKVIFSYRGLCL